MITTTYEVWDGNGKRHVATTDDVEAQRVYDDVASTGAFVHTVRVHSWPCQACRRTVVTQGGYDTECDCGAQYNGFGQRLRDDWRDNPSNYDEEVGDLY